MMANEALDGDFEMEEDLAQGVSVEQEQEEASDTSEEPSDEDVVISIDGEEENEEEQERKQAPEWVRNLRKEHREAVKRTRALEAELEQLRNPVKNELPEKPTLEGFDYDSDRYEEALASWFERKREFDDKQKKEKEAEEKTQQAWNEKVAEYDKTKKELPVADYSDAEDAVSMAMNNTQQGIIIKVVKNPALFIYAIGKNEAKLKELAGMTDPVEFTAAVAKLEDKINMKKRSAPPPESTVRGSGTLSATTDKTLEKLREEAAKTGDYTKVHKYRQQMRNR